MSECSICGEYSDCLHPVDFHSVEGKETPKEIEEFIGLGGYLDDTEASEGEDDFWENCARLCHACMEKYDAWIAWFG